MARIAKAGWGAIFLAAFLPPYVASAAAQSHGVGIAHAGPARSATVRAGGIRHGAQFATPLQPNFAPIARVPGLAFNVQALAAGRPGFAHRRGQFGTPLLWYSPFYSPYADYSYDDYAAPQAPYAYADEQGQQATVPPPQYAPSEQPAAAEELEPPPPEASQFILVRLDGQVLFAVAFTAVDGRLTYVTPEGLRRSFPVAELDKQATRQMNDANGTSVSLPD